VESGELTAPTKYSHSPRRRLDAPVLESLRAGAFSYKVSSFPSAFRSWEDTVFWVGNLNAVSSWRSISTSECAFKANLILDG